MDVARYGDWATMAYTNAKVRENYSRPLPHPLPERGTARRPAAQDDPDLRPAASEAQRGVRRLLGAGACRSGSRRQSVQDEFSLRRSNDFESVAAECRAVRDGVGLIEISNFAKYEVTGPGASWLDRLLPERMPAVGRMALAPMLKHAGLLIGDFTVARLAPETFMSSDRASPSSSTCAGS